MRRLPELRNHRANAMLTNSQDQLSIASWIYRTPACMISLSQVINFMKPFHIPPNEITSESGSGNPEQTQSLCTINHLKQRRIMKQDTQINRGMIAGWDMQRRLCDPLGSDTEKSESVQEHERRSHLVGVLFVASSELNEAQSKQQNLRGLKPMSTWGLFRTFFFLLFNGTDGGKLILSFLLIK